MESGLDAVLKVGGSLGRGAGLPELGRAWAELGRRYRLLIVPGGGEFADQVRAAFRRFSLSETAGHRMALLAMDQYGHLLAELVPGSSAVSDLRSAREIAASGRVAVLLPAALLLQADPLPNCWGVTSDSLGAWLAGLAGAPRYVLLKDVDGLYAGDPMGPEPGGLLGEVSPAELAGGQGGVDEYLGAVLTRLTVETWVINGQRPERLAELLATGRTVGTRIRWA